MRVAVIGEHQPGYGPQEATMAALHHAADRMGRPLDAQWVSSVDVDDELLSGVDGVFMSPGALYQDLDAALGAVTCCRRTGTPLTGTCGGFQHTMVALAREAGVADATHEESGLAGTPVVTKLECSLVGQLAAVRVEEGTLARRLYRTDRVLEELLCSYSLDPAFEYVVEAVGSVVSGRDDDGVPRIVEDPAHPYFLVTLYLPQLTSSPGRPHPLIAGFLSAVEQVSRAAGRPAGGSHSPA